MSQSAMSMALIAAKSVPPSVLNSVVYIWVQCPSMSQALLPISSLPDSRICVITAALVGGVVPSPPTNAAVMTQIRESGKLLMGKSAWDIEGHWTQMYTTEFNTLGGTLFAAMSAIDIALWDIVGKKLGVPVYKLLGGRAIPNKKSLRIYASEPWRGIPSTREAYTARTKEIMAK